MMTAEQLRALLDYDPETGEFTWKVSVGRQRSGRPAGTIADRGYVKIQYGRRHYKAHRLAWLYMTGAWPSKPVRHKNGSTGDNRFVNLRITKIDDLKNALPRRF